MKQLKKTLLTLVALFAMTTGAWADETLLVTITAADNSDFKSGEKTFDNVVKVSFSGEVSFNTTNNGWYAPYTAGRTLTVAAANDDVTITRVKFYTTQGDAEDTTKPFEAELKLKYVMVGSDSQQRYIVNVNGSTIGSETSSNYLTKIEVYGTKAPAGKALNPDATRKVWTLDAMPAGNVELQVAYYPGMLTLAQAEGGSIAVDGLSLGVKQLNPPASWNGQSTNLTASDLEGFQPMTLADAKALGCPVTSGEVYLVYAFNGDEAQFINYDNGNLNYEYGASFTKADLYKNDYNIYYTGATLPAGFEKDDAGNIYVEAGKKFTVKAVPAEGYQLVGWSDDATIKDLEREFTMPADGSDFTVTATFSDEFELTFDDVNFKTNQNITVKVGDADKTLDQDGKLSVKSGQTVTLTAKQGYKFRSVEAKKAVKAKPALSINIGDASIHYNEGELWKDAIQKYPTENAGWSIDGNTVKYNGNYTLCYDDWSGSAVFPQDPIDAESAYKLVAVN